MPCSTNTKTTHVAITKQESNITPRLSFPLWEEASDSVKRCDFLSAVTTGLYMSIMTAAFIALFIRLKGKNKGTSIPATTGLGTFMKIGVRK